MSSKKAKTRSDASSSSGSRVCGESVVADCGRRRSSCGYCKSSSRSSISHGLLAASLTVYDYQDLLDRGWRRSGCFLYKPEMDKTCCPSYTIRLKASDFVPSKEHQRVLRRLERFLNGQLDVKIKDQTEDPGTSFQSEVSDSARKKLVTARREEKSNVEPIMNDLSEQIDHTVQRCIQQGEFPSSIQIPKASVKKVLAGKRKQIAEGPEEILYTSNISFQIAAAIKRTQASERADQSINEENRLSPEIISEKLATAMNLLGNIHGLSIKVCKGHINFLSASKDSGSDRDVSADSVSEGETLNAATISSESPQTRSNRILEIELKRSSFDVEEHELYKRYQLKVHNDKPDHVTERSYRRFLVDTPLIDVPSSDDDKVPPCGFGSFHQQYRIDGRLIAVGVVDILPKCMSSKYLFWDPDYAFLSLGKYSALQEISWVHQNQAHCSSLQYYYLGYYIHSCSKMRYKAAYSPSELLCPLRYKWVPFETAKRLLDERPYVVLSDFTDSQSRDSFPSQTSAESMVETRETEQGETNDHLMDYNDDGDDDDDDEMDATESDNRIASLDRDIGNVLIGVGESRYRYKEIERVMNPAGRKHLESLLPSYKNVVGSELSERMVYDLT